MVPEFEEWHLVQGAGLGDMSPHPVSAQKEGGRSFVLEQRMVDPQVESGRNLGRLAYIKGKGDVRCAPIAIGDEMDWEAR